MDNKTADKIEKHLKSIAKSLEEIAKNTQPCDEDECSDGAVVKGFCDDDDVENNPFIPEALKKSNPDRWWQDGKRRCSESN